MKNVSAVTSIKILSLFVLHNSCVRHFGTVLLGGPQGSDHGHNTAVNFQVDFDDVVIFEISDDPERHVLL